MRFADRRVRRSRETGRPRAARGHPVRLGQHAGQYLADHHRVLSRHLHGARPAAVDRPGGARPRARFAARSFSRPVRRATPARRRRCSTRPSTASISSGCEPLPGAERSAGRAAATLGCYVAVVSNKVGDNLRAELEHLGWERWISRAVGARDAQRDKPAPDPIFLALDGTGIAPDERYGWSATPRRDLKCAHAAGCLPVFCGRRGDHCRSGLHGHPAAPHARDCHELAALL